MARKPTSGSGGFWWDFPVWQPFKWNRKNPSAHSGIDLGMAIGTTIVAPFDGTFINGTREPWGGQVNYLVQFPDGPRVLSFLHLSQIAPHGAGASISAGDILGYSGEPPSPQYGSGAHLHFEVTHGTVAPYEGYSPTHPTGSSYPMDPAPLLSELQKAGAPIPHQNMPGTGPGQGIVAATGAVPGFLALAQGLANAEAFPGWRGVSITNLSPVFDNIGAFAVRFLFVTLGALILLFVLWNLIAKPAIETVAPAVGPAALAALA